MERDVEEHEIMGIVMYESDKAYLLNMGDREMWMPKSMMKHIEMDNDKNLTAVIPMWLAVKKDIA